MENLEQKASDNELLAKSIEKAKITQKKSYKSFILYGLIPVTILFGVALYEKYETGIENLESAHQQCEQVKDKSTIRSTAFGRHSCNKIEEFYKKANE